MQKKYIKEDPWSLIQEGWNAERVESSESLFSIGNGFIGQRANFEETYSGKTFQGSYVGGVYYPDKTRVGWWKNGYPEYFAKVLNAPNWIGLKVICNDEELDLNLAKEIINYRLELNMRAGWLNRSFEIILQNGSHLKINSRRFISLAIKELGAIKYDVQLINIDADVKIIPFVDADINNSDSNWDHKFWNIVGSKFQGNAAWIRTITNKTNFDVATFMDTKLILDSGDLVEKNQISGHKKVEHNYEFHLEKGQSATLIKFGGYVSSLNTPSDGIDQKVVSIISKANEIGFDALLNIQKKKWGDVWKMSDIQIEGDVSAQQGIRFNIFQLNQTYNGEDYRLNIGPKGFTGEKYGGGTYWDTEAYCLPFYMVTKNQEVALNLLRYRYQHLEKAKENAIKLGFNTGAALYPMVTMNGEECHNEWEITFEEIHRNGAISYAIFNYTRYTGDTKYLFNEGIEVLIAVARFWVQRVHFSKVKNQYVILGVTGPNEYENNVNNNWYTNFIAKWCMSYALETLDNLKQINKEGFEDIKEKLLFTDAESEKMKNVSENIYLPYDSERDIFLQQDLFLDKEIAPASSLKPDERPINQNWSWDRILRSCYIKQADVLQGMYLFEDQFTKAELERNFEFYEPLTVHESSLSPCVHSILASSLGRTEKAYSLYLRTSRLDIDDYNHEVEEGCHITSMAGTWLSIVEGFGGMRILNDRLSFNPKIPDNWKAYTFKVNFRNHILRVEVSKESTKFVLEKGNELELYLNGNLIQIESEARVLS